MSWLWQAWVGRFLVWYARELGAGAMCLFLRLLSCGEIVETNSSELPEFGNFYMTQAPVS